MLGILLTGISSAFGELSDSIGKKGVHDKAVSLLMGPYERELEEAERRQRARRVREAQRFVRQTYDAGLEKELRFITIGIQENLAETVDAVIELGNQEKEHIESIQFNDLTSTKGGRVFDYTYRFALITLKRGLKK